MAQPWLFRCAFSWSSTALQLSSVQHQVHAVPESACWIKCKCMQSPGAFSIARIVHLRLRCLLTGFFFGMRRSIDRAAFNATGGQLFNPSNRIIGQEGDLYARMAKMVRPRIRYMWALAQVISQAWTCNCR